VGSEDPGRGREPVDVVWCRVEADEDDGLGLAALGGEVRVEHDGADGGAGRGRQTGRGFLHLGSGIDHRVQHVVERSGVDALDRIGPRDDALARHLDRGAQRRGGRPLRRARLQDVELALLDRELDVLDVAVVLLELVHRGRQRGVRDGLHALELVEGLRGANARDDVLALRVDEELAVEPLFAGRRVA
jgi:hypothetical protein